MPNSGSVISRHGSELRTESWHTKSGIHSEWNTKGAEYKGSGIHGVEYARNGTHGDGHTGSVRSRKWNPQVVGHITREWNTHGI